MNTPHSLSLQQARHLHLAAQGLLRPPAKRAVYQDLINCISRMSLLQIDTIHVVARSPYLVLFSRLGNYPQAWLEQALAQGDLFEYWAHEACFIPRADYRLLRHRMLAPERLGWKYNAQWVADHQQAITELLQLIQENGPVRAADFTHADNPKSGWWAWKPHKRHLENLFSAGELMVTERRNFQRVYDLRSRVMPDWQDAVHGISEAEATRQMLMNSARSLGIFRAAWLPDYYRLKRAPLNDFISEAQAAGDLVAINTEGLGEMWLHRDYLPLLETPLQATHSALLSPFDPVVWDRKRALELFSFDYRIECYTPEEKRKFGYFVLPILHRGQIKGRLDARMLRQAKQLEIKKLWLEETTRVTARFVMDILRAIERFAAWQGAESVTILQAPDALKDHWPAQWRLD
ncbi:winged helix-turn-helix domain-containing protein [Pantoea vagans]|uniref:winged helix-turn-helix domain-containing protein n=1 Tax=Pantoea vagans TaxID=470934 RepID=UPI0023B1B8FA|nr:winged helix-turn-helix domain-containing protein [Pantoea vagans]MDE8555536.1 winged helix-turn-helix domain-containing protein [Pantoea vagans]MDE8575587.1 winged helix-turn-helix domain-containing protein [Pantoea vagans]